MTDTITAEQLEEWRESAAAARDDDNSLTYAETLCVYALPALLTEVERLRALVRGFLDCPEIADCAPDDKDPETDALERRARAALQEEPADAAITGRNIEDLFPDDPEDPDSPEIV